VQILISFRRTAGGVEGVVRQGVFPVVQGERRGVVQPAALVHDVMDPCDERQRIRRGQGHGHIGDVTTVRPQRAFHAHGRARVARTSSTPVAASVRTPGVDRATVRSLLARATWPLPSSIVRLTRYTPSEE